MASCKEVVINADYAQIKLGLSQDLAFNFDLNLDYTSLKGEDLFHFTNKSDENSSKVYLGHFGTKNSGNTLKINANYGSVTFK